MKCYRLVVRAKDLEEFQNWAIQTAEAISEFQPSVSMVLSTGLLLISKEILEDDAKHLLHGLADCLT